LLYSRAFASTLKIGCSPPSKENESVFAEPAISFRKYQQVRLKEEQHKEKAPQISAMPLPSFKFCTAIMKMRSPAKIASGRN
jgi:hypothetical protein